MEPTPKKNMARGQTGSFSAATCFGCKKRRLNIVYRDTHVDEKTGLEKKACLCDKCLDRFSELTEKQKYVVTD